MQKIAYIMRGVQGSGKTTRAKQLADSVGIIHSTDEYFYDENHRYVFGAARLQENHTRNYIAFCKSLRAGIPIVICDNTNIKRWHFEGYEKVARALGYKVEVITMPHPDPKIAALRNVHNVPESAIRKMIAAWED